MNPVSQSSDYLGTADAVRRRLAQVRFISDFRRTQAAVAIMAALEHYGLFVVF